MIGIGNQVQIETFCCDTVGALERAMNQFMVNRPSIEIHDIKIYAGPGENHYGAIIYRRV